MEEHNHWNSCRALHHLMWHAQQKLARNFCHLNKVEARRMAGLANTPTNPSLLVLQEQQALARNIKLCRDSAQGMNDSSGDQQSLC